MTVLGYETLGVQGGDWGAWVAIAVSRANPQRVIGAHLNYVPPRYLPAPGEDGLPVGDEERESAERRARWADEEWGYGHIQSTKPQTLAYGLSDSPVGLAAWIIEKFHAWSDIENGFESTHSMDTLLTNVSVYWFTNSIASSMRLYKESKKELASGTLDIHRVGTPFAIAAFPRELPFWPRRHAERYLNIVRWTEFPVDGHFAAMEQPTALVDDVRGFFSSVR